jgi:vacuolar-type H+-ATPase subunit F/Vma7
MAPSTGPVAVIGEQHRVQGFALAGAVVLVAEDDAAVRSQWAALPAEVSVVVLTPAAAVAVGGLASGVRPLTVVMPP